MISRNKSSATRDVRTSAQSRFAGESLRQVSYGYDAVDQLTGESATGGAANWNYSNTFGYDAMGNRTRNENTRGGVTATSRGSSNALNQLTALSRSASGATQTSGLSYDAGGSFTRFEKVLQLMRLPHCIPLVLAVSSACLTSSFCFAVRAAPATLSTPAEATAARDASGVWRRSAALRGQRFLLLTFFPRCFTGNCTTQLTSLREAYPQLQKAGVEVWAISTDPADGAQGQRAFAKHLKLPFPLLPDTDRKISLAFGAVQSREQTAARMSILIGKDGRVRWVDKQINPRTHGADVLKRLQSEGLIPSGPKETSATPSPPTR